MRDAARCVLILAILTTSLFSACGGDNLNVPGTHATPAPSPTATPPL